MKKNYTKKQFILTLFIGLFFTIAASAQSSIDEVIRKFDTAVLNASIPKAEVAIGFISYANTETSGTVVPWLQGEIKKAAAKMRRLSIVNSSRFNTQEQTGIATRGISFAPMKKTSGNKFILSGTYYQNKNNVEVTLELSRTDGTLLISETAFIPLMELTNRHLTLYPDNKEQAESVKAAVITADNVLSEPKSEAKSEVKEEKSEEKTSSAALQPSEKSSVEIPSSKSKSEKNSSKQKISEKTAAAKSSEQKKAFAEDSGTIGVTAAMLDKDSNLVDILFPGDTVKFMIWTDKDSYIEIMGIDANGKQFNLPVKNNMLKANMPRTFPDSDVDYTVLDNAFGAECLLIYAASDPLGLPSAVENGTYKPETIIQATRGMAAVKKEKKIKTGIRAIPYTVMKKN